jgi:hypothetical protein
LRGEETHQLDLRQILNVSAGRRNTLHLASVGIAVTYARFQMALVAVPVLCTLGSVSVRGQVTVMPDSFRVVVAQGQEIMAWLTMHNAGAADVPFCLDFDRPLQRTPNTRLGPAVGQRGICSTFSTTKIWETTGLLTP